MMCHKIGLLPISIMGLGFKWVSSLSRVPSPPAKITAFIAHRHFLVLKNSDLVAKRPGTGISPTKIKNILGKRIKRNLLKDTIITYKDIS